MTETCHSENKNCLSILHLNINRIRNKLLLLEALLDVELKFKPCFICITESWLKPSEETSIRLSGYQIVSSYSRSINLGGGCIMFARDDIAKNCEVCNVERYNVEKLFEVCCVSIQIETYKIFITTMYRSPSSDTKKFLSQLELFLDKNKKHGSILCGDFNIDLKSESTIAVDFLQRLREHNMKPTIKDYTRVTETSQTLVDSNCILC